MSGDAVGKKGGDLEGEGKFLICSGDIFGRAGDVARDDW
jgi:hypothetical protein